MKVIVAHNRYQSAAPSGENSVVDAEIDILRAAGVSVVPFIKDSDSLQTRSAKLKAVTGPVWAPTTRELASLIEIEKPDVIHLHNVYPLISPWAIRTAKARGVAVVHSIHNFRHICVEGQQFRAGEPCTTCSGRRWPTPAVLHGCYRGSRLQSALMAASAGVHQQTWRLADRLLCVSSAQREVFLASGWPGEKLHVKPNAVRHSGAVPPLGQHVLFLGRLSDAKGVGMLLGAWQSVRPAGRRLVIAGDGPLRGRVEEAAARDASIDYLGQIDSQGVSAALRSAAVVVVSSRSQESFGLVAVEAFASGRPVLATRVGALAELVTTDVGLLCEPNLASLKSALATLDETDLAAMGRSARQVYEQRFTPTAVGGALIAHYREVMAMR